MSVGGGCLGCSMTTTAVDTGPATTAEVLAVLRSRKADRDAAEIAMVRATIDWAVLNEVEPDDWYANYGQAIGDRGVPLAGPGAPLVSEFAAMEYAVALGMSTDAGKAYLGRVLELRYRLPRLWDRVVAGKVSVWRAGRIADHTISLPLQGAAHVDRHLAPVAHSCSWAQIDRLVEEALVRFDPEAAEARRREAAERRHFDLHVDQVSYDGTVHVDGELDLADALDLEDAIRAGADSKQPWARLSPWTCAARSLPVSWPAASSPSTSTPPQPVRGRVGRWCSTPTSAKDQWPGAGTLGPRSAWNRSASGAATRPR